MKHYNPSISEDTVNTFNLKGEEISEINEIISPVVIIQRPVHIVRFASVSTNTSTAIFTTPTDKDFYLTFLDTVYTSDVACDCSVTYVDFYVEGVIRYLYLPVTTLTALNIQKTINFNPPIKLDRGTAVRLVGSKSVGTFFRAGTIGGYTVETRKRTF